MHQFLDTFSLILESVCVLPQLLLLRQVTIPTVLDSFYLLALGSYRAFYILNWILRYTRNLENNSVSVVFGIVQTAFYIDFAWVYFTRQRVKLRNGGVVDSEDLSRGWLVGKILGRGVPDSDEENTAATNGSSDPSLRRQVGSRGGWGVRGISVSADDEVVSSKEQTNKARKRTVERYSVSTPEEAVGILAEPASYESEEDIPSPNKVENEPVSDIGNGGEWRHDSSK